MFKFWSDHTDKRIHQYSQVSLFYYQLCYPVASRPWRRLYSWYSFTCHAWEYVWKNPSIHIFVYSPKTSRDFECRSQYCYYVELSWGGADFIESILPTHFAWGYIENLGQTKTGLQKCEKKSSFPCNINWVTNFDTMLYCSLVFLITHLESKKEAPGRRRKPGSKLNWYHSTAQTDILRIMPRNLLSQTMVSKRIRLSQYPSRKLHSQPSKSTNWSRGCWPSNNYWRAAKAHFAGRF